VGLSEKIINSRLELLAANETPLPLITSFAELMPSNKPVSVRVPILKKTNEVGLVHGGYFSYHTLISGQSLNNLY